jgi:pyrroline-5-carboxylate reductase
MAEPKILLVGCGNMGGAMLRGWIGQGRGDRIAVLTPTLSRVPDGVRAFAAAPVGMAPPAVLVLAVKPQKLAEVASGLQALVGAETLLLSVLAAVDAATLRRHFPQARAVVRSVPNLPSAIGQGVTTLAGDGLAESDRQAVAALFQPLGLVEWMEGEAALDASTPVSGCGPAFLFRFADAVSQAAVAQGLSPEQARRLFAQTMIGAGEMLARSELSPAEMARQVASPGGVTQSGLAVLDREDALVRLVGETLAAAARRNAEMAATARD